MLFVGLASIVLHTGLAGGEYETLSSESSAIQTQSVHRGSLILAGFAFPCNLVRHT
jgi:hypothetical protein